MERTGMSRDFLTILSSVEIQLSFNKTYFELILTVQHHTKAVFGVIRAFVEIPYSRENLVTRG